MTLHVKGAWHGWKGDTIVELTDGSKWRQAVYHYEYQYAYMPEAMLSNGRLYVEGMSQAVPVRRVGA